MKKSRFLPCILALFAAWCLLFSCVSCSRNSADWRTGLLTSVSLSVSVDNDRVIATARNDLTVGFATVEVYVSLYSSAEYTTDLTKMQEEKTAYTPDLNIFCSLRAEVSAKGYRYWVAKLRYKSNEQVWSEVCTKPVLVAGKA